MTSAAANPALDTEPLGAATRATPRRVFQYIVDLLVLGVFISAAGYLLDLLVPSADFRLDRDDRIPYLTATGGWELIASLIAPVMALVVFVLIPIATGRTAAMALFGLRVVRTDGTPASRAQHLVRAVFLLIDGACGGLIGFVVMLVSGRRQRIGDHVAGTLVVKESALRR